MTENDFYKTIDKVMAPYTDLEEKYFQVLRWFYKKEYKHKDLIHIYYGLPKLIKDEPGLRRRLYFIHEEANGQGKVLKQTTRAILVQRGPVFEVSWDGKHTRNFNKLEQAKAFYSLKSGDYSAFTDQI